MFRKKNKSEQPLEEIIYDCPNCNEQLIVEIPTKRVVIIQCAECGAKCSVKTARAGKKTWDQVKKDGPPKVEVEEIIPQLGDRDHKDMVRAVSLKPGGKAALERARNARASQRASLPGTSECAKAQPPASEAPPGPVRRSSSRSNRSAPYTKGDSGTGLTPMMSSSRVDDGSKFPPLEGEKTGGKMQSL